MRRLAALGLLAVITGLPLSVGPSRLAVGWLVALALGLGGVGVIAWSLPCVTAAGALTVIAYALALVIAGPPADPVIALALGSALVLLPVLVHWAGHARGAALGPSVLAALARQWLAVVGLGVAVAVALAAATAALGDALRSGALPVVVITAALGVLLTVAGLVVLVAREGGGGADS
jgi:hypothetical protein